MNSALVYLLIRSVQGRIIRTLRLLKQPKYSVGVVIFVVWIFFWVGGPLLFDDDEGAEVNFVNADLFFETLGDVVPAVHLAAALAIAALVSLWWLIPWSRIALNLTEAEIHLLAPMPVRRRHLIQYATLKNQPGILFGCMIMTFFLGSGGPLGRLRWFVSFWLVLSVWDLHSKGRSLWLARQKEMTPARAWWQRAVLVGGLVVFWVVAGTAITALITELLALRPGPDQEIPEFIQETAAAYGPNVQDGLLGWMVLPFLWLTAPFFAAAPGTPIASQMAALLFPISLLLVHNEWVVRSQTKFEEAALAHARREAKKQDASSRYWKTSLRSRHRQPFPLLPPGTPEVAIVWKNLMMVRRTSMRAVIGFGVAVVAAAAVLPVTLGAPEWIYFVLMIGGFIGMMVSPMSAGAHVYNDLRTDLLKIEVLRPWPIPGWRLFAAEVAAPAIGATLSAMLGAGLLLAVDIALTLDNLGVMSMRSSEIMVVPEQFASQWGALPGMFVPLLLLGLLPLLASVCCLTASLQNLAVLLFPGWVQLGQKKQLGAAVFGQNLLVFAGMSLAMLLCLIPATLIVGIILLVQVFVFGVPIVAWEFPILGVVAATPVFAVVGLVIRAGGSVWDRLDPSREVLQGAT